MLSPGAYVEGWGLYSEYLGTELGLYSDPYQLIGRLSAEMWRACRLVVDTGIHALGWPLARAADYMAARTVTSRANIEAEVRRYATWPGQAVGYKCGELEPVAVPRKTPDCNESAALHSYGLESHCRSVLCDPTTTGRGDR